ncbi:hypothetical protein [Caulobacter sp. DWR1-3-2b1]|uniref:hypothetical protein n=1 Tax=Caulobacter sp. DWR1-3-2b1 TaxID=2804670 RepID=UPI003CE6D19D
MTTHACTSARRQGLVMALLIAVGQPSIAFADARGPVLNAVAPMNQTVHKRLQPELEKLLNTLLVEQRDMTLDGTKVFSGDDKFLPGKVAIGLAYLVIDTPRDDPRFATYLAGFKRIADLTIDDTNDTWGMYYYIQALRMLQQTGLLEQAVSPETLARLKVKLDWRRFVRTDDLTLINLPNNYYGVAFSVARLRYQLGWEDASASEALLERTLDHYRKYSGDYGFADETDGEGRFDRYSVLLIGEIAHRLIEAEMPASAEVKTWLRKSIDLMLPRLNMRGEGFEYGRSIGAYGETAFLEVLTAAAKLDVLTAEEKTMAYAFSSRVSARHMDFWFDPAMGSVNLWEHGRRTDAYRGKHRILGENLSLARQHFYTNAVWNELGFTDRVPDPGYAAWLDKLPKRTLTWFARGEHDRLVVTLRDRGRVISLPVISGGRGQHENSPYYPVPFSPGMLSGVADGQFPQLLPMVKLEEGALLAPLAYARDVKVTTKGLATTVVYRQDQMDRLGEAAPIADDRLSIQTTYAFGPGRITRTDVISAQTPLSVASIDLDFAGFSQAPTTEGGKTRFKRGDVTKFATKGFKSCRSRPLADEETYRTPTGAMTSLVQCSTGPIRLANPVTLSWTLNYK